MSQHELIKMIEILAEWEALQLKAKKEADAIRDRIKETMLNLNTEELFAGTYVIRWTPVRSCRFDTTAFRSEYSALYQQFTKQINSRRFTIT